MSILDKVYTTFNRLERDFARSNKTRSEFIADKFGGDINIGSTIILDAIRGEGLEETPENIAKMSYVKDVFARIRECADILDTLQSFEFSDSDLFSDLMDILLYADGHMSGQECVNQHELWNNNDKCLHYISTPTGIRYASVDGCKVFRVFNENIVGLLEGAFGLTGSEIDEVYKVLPSHRLKKIQEGAIARNLK